MRNRAPERPTEPASSPNPAAPRRLTSGPLAAIERLLRGGDRGYFSLFERAGDNAARAAELLERLLVAVPDGESLAQQIEACETVGDRATQEVMRCLNASFVTPIDREDIIRLASTIDDIVDFIDEAAGYLILYRVEAPMEQAQALAGVLVDATRHLARAIRMMSRLEDIDVQADTVHRLETQGDQILRHAIASLFEAGIDPMTVIRWKDIFERLEDAIDATESAMYVLQDIIIKNI